MIFLEDIILVIIVCEKVKSVKNFLWFFCDCFGILYWIMYYRSWLKVECCFVGFGR